MQFQRIATVKDYDGSFGERAVTVDANFTKLVIDEMQVFASYHAIFLFSQHTIVVREPGPIGFNTFAIREDPHE